MSDENIAPDGNEGSLIDVVPAPASESSNPRDIANFLTDYRRKRDAAEKQPPAAPEKAAAEPEPSKEEPAAPAEEATSEAKTETTEPEAELPPIEPPRSWTKEEKEEFSTYPREAQEKIARREQDRETALRRGQNETAEQKKALEAEKQKVEQARQQYEAALPQLLQTLHEQQMGEFADIKTMADVEKLAREDWPRYALWDAQQKKVAAITQELKSAQERQTTEFQSKWSEFASKEDAEFLKLAPEMADKEKATKIADASVAMLKDIGFADADLAKLWNGEASVSLRDHRLQLIIRDAARYREAKVTTPQKVVTKPVPNVQRPGVAQSRNSDADERVKTLEKQLEKSGSVKDAVALMVARRAAR